MYGARVCVSDYRFIYTGESREGTDSRRRIVFSPSVRVTSRPSPVSQHFKVLEGAGPRTGTVAPVHRSPLTRTEPGSHRRSASVSLATVTPSEQIQPASVDVPFIATIWTWLSTNAPFH